MIDMISTRENIINLLSEYGYIAKSFNVIKNGVVFHGITLQGDKNVSPCIYCDNLIRSNRKIDDIVKLIISIYESQKDFDFDISLFQNNKWLLDNIYISLQKKSSENIVKRLCEFDDIEQYLYICLDSDIDKANENEYHTIKLNESILQLTTLQIDEIWEAAAKNTFSANRTVIKPLGQILSEISGNQTYINDDTIFPIYVISNITNFRGSIQIFDKKAISEWASKIAQKPNCLICIPSSIHECLLIVPYDETNINLREYDLMVSEVNATEVLPVDQLCNHAFILTL